MMGSGEPAYLGAIDIPAELPRRSKQAWGAAGVGVAAAVVIVVATVIALALGGDLHTAQAITGIPTANPNAVAEAAADRKAEAEAEAAAKQAADDADFLAHLEVATRDSMQEFFDDPENDLGLPITVMKVNLIKLEGNKYEGMATLKAGRGPQRDILVHVTADEHAMMWNTDPGALIPLFR